MLPGRRDTGASTLRGARNDDNQILARLLERHHRRCWRPRPRGRRGEAPHETGSDTSQSTHRLVLDYVADSGTTSFSIRRLVRPSEAAKIEKVWPCSDEIVRAPTRRPMLEQRRLDLA